MTHRPPSPPPLRPEEWTSERLKEGLDKQGYPFLHRLSRLIDVDSKWRDIAANLPNLIYEEHEVERFGMAVSSPSGSPGYLMLLNLVKRCYPLEDFVSALKKTGCDDGLKLLGYTERVRVVRQPESRPISVGQRLELVCEGEGVPRPQYLWFKADAHGHPLPLPRHTGSRLVVEEVVRGDSGRYCCRVMNCFSRSMPGRNTSEEFSRWIEVLVRETVETNGVAVMNVPPGALPVVVNFPAEVLVEEGQPLVIPCDARGVQPLRYQWYKENQLLSFGQGREMVVERVLRDHAGEYLCKVSNNFGDKLTRPCVVRVTTPSTPPHIPPREGLYSGPVDYPPISPHWVPGQADHLGMYYDADQSTARVPPINASKSNIDSSYNGSLGFGMDVPLPRPPTALPNPQPSPPELNPAVKCTDKVALLIGNVKYRVGRHNNLSTPETDVSDLTGLLTSLGFKCVSLINLTKEEMEHAILYFLTLLGPGVYALFFFAGHGFEVDSRQYLMSVDASAHHNPQECVCVQQLKQDMHTSGSKLNILLLDMCRDKLTTPMPHPAHFDAEQRNNPHGNQALPSNTYTVIGYATSEAGLSYEPRLHSGQPQGEQNSFFVRAIKEALRTQKNSNVHNLSEFLSQVQKIVRQLKPNAIGNTPWQLPQVVSNLGEDLSLTDPIDEQPEHGLQHQRSLRQRLWEKALTIPKELIISSLNQVAPFRLSFRAEYTNVLIVTIELLKGSRWSVQLQDISLELRSQPSPGRVPLSPTTPECLVGMAIEDSSVQRYSPKESLHKDITFFRIPDIQKIRPPLFMFLSFTYSYSSHQSPVTSLAQTCQEQDTVQVQFMDPPLYASLYGPAAPDPSPHQPHSCSPRMDY